MNCGLPRRKRARRLLLPRARRRVIPFAHRGSSGRLRASSCLPAIDALGSPRSGSRLRPNTTRSRLRSPRALPPSCGNSRRRTKPPEFSYPRQLCLLPSEARYWRSVARIERSEIRVDPTSPDERSDIRATCSANKLLERPDARSQNRCMRLRRLCARSGAANAASSQRSQVDVDLDHHHASSAEQCRQHRRDGAGVTTTMLSFADQQKCLTAAEAIGVPDFAQIPASATSPVSGIYRIVTRCVARDRGALLRPGDAIFRPDGSMGR